MAEDDLTARALALLASTPLIDGHNDWPHLIRGMYDNKIQNTSFDRASSLVGHVDIGRLIKGRSGGVFLSAYVDCPKPENDFSDGVHLEPMRDTIQQIDLIYRLVDKYDDVLELVYSGREILPTFQRGRIVCLIGVEGLHQIGNSAAALRMFHRLGVRYVTLTHNQSNLFAESATANGPPFTGVSSEGLEIIQEMNRIGMMIDLSHASESAACAVLQASLAPVAFTHSSAYGLCAHPRNVSDRALRLLHTNRGIVMVSLVPAFTSTDAKRASIANVVDHILYIADKIGFDHVGIGSDFDGMEKSVDGLADVSKFPELVMELLRRDVGEDQIQKIIGLNLIRVLHEVEDVATRQKVHLPVLEDKVKQLWSDQIRAYARSFYPDAG